MKKGILKKMGISKSSEKKPEKSALIESHMQDDNDKGCALDYSIDDQWSQTSILAFGSGRDTEQDSITDERTSRFSSKKWKKLGR